MQFSMIQMYRDTISAPPSRAGNSSRCASGYVWMTEQRPPAAASRARGRLCLHVCVLPATDVRTPRGGPCVSACRRGERAYWRDNNGPWTRERAHGAAADKAAPSGEPPPRYEVDVVRPAVADVWLRRGWRLKGDRRGRSPAAPRGPATATGSGDVVAATADATGRAGQRWRTADGGGKYLSGKDWRAFGQSGCLHQDSFEHWIGVSLLQSDVHIQGSVLLSNAIAQQECG